MKYFTSYHSMKKTSIMIFDDKLIAIMILCNFYNIKARFIYIVSGATKHLYNCPLVHRLVGWLVGQ